VGLEITLLRMVTKIVVLVLFNSLLLILVVRESLVFYGKKKPQTYKTPISCNVFKKVLHMAFQH